MPICKREGFDNNSLLRNKDEHFHDNDEVFFCEVTKEIFREYEDYFRHVMAINSTVWQCEATGRDNLTFAEALKSERKARKKMETFKDSLRPPVMLVIESAKQSSMKALTALTLKFLRKRYFLKEEVSTTSKKNHIYSIIEILPQQKINANGVFEDTESFQYKLRRTNKEVNEEIIIPFENIRRQRFQFTAENMQMFIKNNVIRVDGLLRPKPESYKKYVIDRKITFSSLFIGKMPHFTPAKIRRPQPENNKKQSSINKYFVKNEVEDDINVKANAGQDKEKLEKERIEKEKNKAKLLKETMERLRLEKQQKLAELEKERLEKRAKLMQKIESECTALLTKTDDLERTDQRLLPTFKSIKTLIPQEHVGDAFMIREFIHSFSVILSGVEVFRGNLSFMEISRALTVREVAGPLSDILLVLIGSIFDLQKEEEDECAVKYLKLRKESRQREPFITMSEAARTHYYAKRHFSFKINELPIDAWTLSEVLRLHILSSGACVNDKADKWRIMYRNGYSSAEDPGLDLRVQHPHILHLLKTRSVYQLPLIDILRISNCLVSQILTYSSCINVIEERIEQISAARFNIRALNATENRRLTNLQSKKKLLTNEYHQQCMEDDIKNDIEKKNQLQVKLNKQLSELNVQSDRERRKYEQELEKLNFALFNFLVYLGQDRAYRKYYVYESMPGIFVEHSNESYDKCLINPPKNNPTSLREDAENLPKNRKELKAYLLRLYTNEEKKSSATALAAAAKNKTVAISQENKENQINHQMNGLSKSDGEIDENTTVVTNSKETTISSPLPTQDELYMCTGDQENCIVHSKYCAERKNWTFIYEKEDIDKLIASLNSLGERESHLREQLTTLRDLIINHLKKCPSDALSIDGIKSLQKFKSIMITDTYRKYNKANYGFPEGSDLNEVLYSSLVDQILQFENDIYTGDLGRLKVKNMQKWREDIKNNEYDPQGKLQWGPIVDQHSSNAANEDDDNCEDGFDDDNDLELKDGGQYVNKPFWDPGTNLPHLTDYSIKFEMNIKKEDNFEDNQMSSNDSNFNLPEYVKNLASALLQVEQAIERRFMKEPFGVPLKDIGNKEFLERKIKLSADRLKQWEISLMESTSYSQVFLHLNILHDSIVWARSTNKSFCQVCRRGSDPDKMLLCDECNGGTHMFCMKPKMKTVPEGNWYCQKCIKRLGVQNNSKEEKKKRKFIMEDDEASTISSESNVSKVISNRRTSNRRNNKQLVSNEIDGSSEEDAEDENVGEIEDSQEEYTWNDKENENSESGNEEELEEENDEEDENICAICSYEGSDVICIKCKESYHLECINLKRPSRNNFICAKCKSKEDKKRKLKTDESDESDDNESKLGSKRSRQSRSSLRQSQNNNSITSLSGNQRRSNRRTGENLPLNSSSLYKLLEDVVKHEQSWPFLRPVSQSEVPDYYKVIKYPMDFAKVKSKLNMGEYQLNEEVMNDIQLIFNNCDQYNEKDNEIYQAGAALENFIISRCRNLSLPFKPSDMNN